jgi:hypothetical protein
LTRDGPPPDNHEPDQGKAPPATHGPPARPRQGNGKGTAATGVGGEARSPKPRPSIVDVSRNLSNEKRFDRTRPTRDSPARAGRHGQAAAAPQARRTGQPPQRGRAKRARDPRPGNRPGPGPRPAPATARGRQPPQARTPRDHPGHARAWHGQHHPTAPRHERPARPKARHSPAKTQARQPAPACGVRPESGTPARPTGHQCPYRYETVSAQRAARYSNNRRDVPVWQLSGHCTAITKPLD